MARLQTSDCTNPVLDVWIAHLGKLVDVFALSYQIFDATSGAPTQIFPVTAGQRVTVDPTADCPDGPRLGCGHYVATFTVPDGATLGRYLVRWFFRHKDTSEEHSYVNEFEVRSAVFTHLVGSGFTPAPLYCSVQDMRDEGVPASFADPWIYNRIRLAQQFVEATTRRFFYPKPLKLRMNGTGGPKLFFNDPIIAVEYIKFEVSPLYPEDFTSVETDIFRVYNRHLSMNLLEPDDRNNPHIELFNPGFVRNNGRYALLTRLSFPEGQQSVEVKGLFGYTEPDGSSTGKTPDMIRHVTKLLVIRQLDKMTSSGRSDAQNKWRLQSESTRDQSYALEGLGALKLVPGNGFTGDPEIDDILAYFSRPPAMGSA